MQPKNNRIDLSDYDMIIVSDDNDELLVSIDTTADKQIIVKNGVKVVLRPKDTSLNLEEYL